MPTPDSKTYIVNDQPTETDALDFMPYVESLADIIQTGNTLVTSKVDPKYMLLEVLYE